MIPPIDNAVLTANPKFAQLHKTLTTKYLNPDGGTKNHPAQAERDARSAELRELRLKATRAHILRTALANLPLTAPAASPSTKPSTKSSTKPQRPSPKTPDTPLPPELTELIILLSLYLRGPLPPSSTALLKSTPTYHTLPTHLPTISSLLSTHLVSLALPLTRLLNPHTNPSYLHRSIPTLPTSILTLRTNLSTKRQHIASARASLTADTVQLLKLYTAQAEAIIRILEQTTHGSLSRHARAKAEMLSLQCTITSLEARQKEMLARTIIYDPPALEALRNYSEHLRDAKARLKARKKDVERDLAGYGVGREDGGTKERVMREIARVWGVMEGEMEEVRRDIERLKGA